MKKAILLLVVVVFVPLLQSRAQQLIFNPAFQGTAQTGLDLGGNRLSNGLIDWSLLTGKPATAAGIGIANGAVLDSWGVKAVPSGAVVGTTDTQALTGKTVNGLTVSPTTGTLAIGSGKTFTASNTLILAGTDGSTLAIGTGGTLGSAAYTASTTYPLKANNLSDLGSAATARTNLGLSVVAASGSASDLGAGTLPAARLPAFTGDVASSAGTSATTIQANAVTNAQLAQMAAMTLKGNVAAAAANPADVAMPAMGYKNLLVGGDFSTNPWQRGTSFSPLQGQAFLSSYTADRWAAYAGATASVTRITGLGLAGVQNAMRVQKASGQAASYIGVGQVLRSAVSIPLQGKTVTLSFWARCGANYSGAANAGEIQWVTGTGIDEGGTLLNGVGTGVARAFHTFTFTTSWVKYTDTFTVPATATELGISLENGAAAGTSGAGDYYDIACVQVEANPYATAFEVRPAEVELALCQAYYETGGGGAAFENYCTGQCTATTAAKGFIPFKAPKRVAPAITLSGAASLWAADNAGGSQVAGTAVSSSNPTVRGFELDLTTASGLVGGNATNIRANNSTAQGWIANAEL